MSAQGVQDGKEGVAGRNGREKFFPNEGSLIYPTMIFLMRKHKRLSQWPDLDLTPMSQQHMFGQACIGCIGTLALLALVVMGLEVICFAFRRSSFLASLWINFHLIRVI